MVTQGWPMFAAGMTGERAGKVYAVVGWEGRGGYAGHLPVIVPIDGGSLAEGYDTSEGLVRLFASEADARFAAGKARADR